MEEGLNCEAYLSSRGSKLFCMRQLHGKPVLDAVLYTHTQIHTHIDLLLDPVYIVLGDTCAEVVV